MSKSVVALAFLALNFYIYNWFASVEVVPPRESFASFPLQLGNWTCPRREQMDEATLKNLGASDYLICDYQRRDPPGLVDVYVGYHAMQVRQEEGVETENTIHTPKHCLPGSGWDIIGQEKVLLDLRGMPERPAQVNRLVIAKGEARQLVFYWYQTQGRVIADDWKKIILLTWDRARRHRTDGSLVRFSTPILRGDAGRAERELLDVASQLVPRLPAYLPE